MKLFGALFLLDQSIIFSFEKANEIRSMRKGN